ncbi:riboflavin aldehyde-forming enzyme [Colletotrichum incanum]|uniref:Riboflavin aldehyde-forming enzyme n=1 Tax=Colletotrichum incanum TaxID=1573173 RepID=A0A162N2D2_COLIC|nr:riboflavin aldehyde-forming enzyme [Colletotrichum incanum]
MFVKVIITAAATGLTVMGVNAAPLTTDQAQALQIINKARVVAGVPALVWDTTLQDDANSWAEKIAAAGYLERAPASQRNGSGEVVGFFQALDADNVVLRNPLSESAKLWLESDGMAKTAVRSEALSKPEQLMSIKATEIGCAIAHGIDDNGFKDSLRVFTVCRVFKDVFDSLLARTSAPALKGHITFFSPGLGACGKTDNDGSMISNGNPLCGRQVLIRGPKGDATVTITDKCMGCAIHDIDVSPAVFERIGGDKGLGRVGNVEWSLI